MTDQMKKKKLLVLMREERKNLSAAENQKISVTKQTPLFIKSRKKRPTPILLEKPSQISESAPCNLSWKNRTRRHCRNRYTEYLRKKNSKLYKEQITGTVEDHDTASRNKTTNNVVQERGHEYNYRRKHNFLRNPVRTN